MATDDFLFGFNDIRFSDRVLRIEIAPDGNLCGHQQDKKQKKDNELCDRECGIEVKAIHISSIILAAKSPFFLKLFSNGMKESQEHHVTLRMDSSEEVAFMDLLKFMYNSTLSSPTASSVLDLLLVADKFQVSSCIRYCIDLLCDLPMTCESALQLLHLPWSVTMTDGIQLLIYAANKYFPFLKDFTKENYTIWLKAMDEVELESATAAKTRLLEKKNLILRCENATLLVEATTRKLDRNKKLRLKREKAIFLAKKAAER